MPVIKCKNCGGDIELSTDKTFGTCEYCGSTMTLPKVSNEQRAAAFNRGNHFRRIGEFDKALAVYERIVEEDDTDAEAHWCCALCRFGIEYVEDSSTYEWIPTCHRASFDSFLEDVDYLAALEYSDGITRRQYQKEAVKIADVQRGILATSQNEEPFDVFICYKELDSDGQRTKDSILAQDIYYNLTDQGWRVFFSRITLEDKAGTEYEPYIFAALNSAKVMICLGTKPEHFNAVWVKNEWSRFISIMKKDRSKLLLPCYRDMDPYDLPEQLSVLQAYDMGKIGFIQDLLRGVGKVLNAGKKQEPVKPNETAWTDNGNSTWQPLLKRGNMALEDGDFAKADELFEQVLNINPECAEAYSGKLLVEENCRNYKDLEEKRLRISQQAESTIVPACQVEKETIKEAVERNFVPGYLSKAHLEELFQFNLEYSTALESRKKQYKAEQAYWESNKLYKRATSFATAQQLGDLKAVQEKVLQAMEKRIETAETTDEAERGRIISAYKQHLALTTEKASKLKEDALEKAKIDRIATQKGIKRVIICLVVAVSMMAFYLVTTKMIIPSNSYRDAENLLKVGNFESAATAFEKLGSFKDSKEKMQESYYARAEELLTAGDYDASSSMFKKLENYSDAQERALEAYYLKGEKALSDKDYQTAIESFTTAGTYKDSADRISYSYYEMGISEANNGNLYESLEAFKNAGGYNDASEKYDRMLSVLRDWGTHSFSLGRIHALGLKSDGTVIAAGHRYNWDGQCNVESWNDITAISAGGNHSVGLKKDGTVVAVGNNDYGQCNVSGWRDIVAISAGWSSTIGLKSDGTVVVAGSVCAGEKGKGELSDWRNIVAISAGDSHIVGLKSDGTVVAVGDLDDQIYELNKWKDIVSIKAGTDCSKGIKADGTFVSTSDVDRDLANEFDILAIAGDSIEETIGLKTDGTITDRRVASWNNVIAVDGEKDRIIGVTIDGRILCYEEQAIYGDELKSWRDINVPDIKEILA